MAQSSCQNDPMFYLKFAYSVKDNGEPEAHWMLSEVPRALRQVGVQGDSVVDIGCGPTIHNAACLAPHFHNIYLADYEQGYRDFLEKWLKKENAGFDWAPYFKIIGNNTGSDAESVEERLRERVKDVWYCDVKKPRADLPLSAPAAFDAVFSAGVIAGSTSNKDEQKNAISNVVALIKPGGYFIYNDLIQPSKEEVEKKFKDCEHGHQQQPEHGDQGGVESEHGASMTEQEFREEMEALGLAVLHFNKNDKEEEYFQGFGEFLLIARKP